LEADVLGAHIIGGPSASLKVARALGWLEPDASHQSWRRNRERDEFVDKVSAKFGISIQWPFVSEIDEQLP
jgi:hypothetical protein